MKHIWTGLGLKLKGPGSILGNRKKKADQNCLGLSSAKARKLFQVGFQIKLIYIKDYITGSLQKEQVFCLAGFPVKAKAKWFRLVQTLAY